MKKSKIVLKLWQGIILALQAVASTILAVSIVRMGILSIIWVVLIMVALAALLLAVLGGFIFARKAKKTLYIICTILSIIVTCGCIFAFQYTNSFNNLLDKISQSEPENNEAVEAGDFSKPFIVYISGSDSRESIDDETARSDVNIVAVVNPGEGKILLVSIPRDTYVQLHGTEGLKDKLTHAGLGMYYDSEMSKLTIQDFLDIEVDYTIKVSFETVVKVVDELGGVEIFSDTALNLKVDKKNKTCNIIYGPQIVDGDCALRFSRERKSYYRGDKHRGENQQEVLTGIINKLSSSRDYVLKLPAILEIAGDSFKTSFSRDDISTLIRKQLEEPTNWRVESISVDGEGQYLPTYTYGEKMSLYVMIADEDSVASAKLKIDEYSREKDD